LHGSGPTLVVDLLGSLGAAYATEFASAQRPFITTDGRYESLATAVAGAPSIERLVLILPAERTPEFVAILDLCASIAAENPRCRTCLVGSFRAHFGDAAYQRMEEDTVKSFRATANGVVVLRAGNVRAAASPSSLPAAGEALGISPD
jgi:hypothetical protein